MKKLVFSLAITRPNGEKDIIEVFDYAEIGSREAEIEDKSQQLLFEEEPPKP